ncbi:MAG: N-acetyltransferase [Telluria sp.]
MKTRVLTPADVNAYRGLRLSGILESPGVAWASHGEESRLSLEQIQQRLTATPHQIIFGGFLDRRLVAIGGFKREAMSQVHHRGNIWGLYVAPAVRGKGLGRLMLSDMLVHMRQIPELVQLTLVVSSDNDVARSMYEKLGFVKTGVERRSVCIDGHYHDEDRMVLFLDGQKEVS